MGLYLKLSIFALCVSWPALALAQQPVVVTNPDVPTNLDQLSGAAPSATNPLPARITIGTAYIDPRDRNWTITETVPVSGPLTDTQLRATPVPVSGTLTGITNAVSTTTQWTNPTVSSATLTTTTCPGTGCLAVSGLTQVSMATVGVTGTFTGVVVMAFDVSEDGTNFVGTTCVQNSTATYISSYAPTSAGYEIVGCPLYGQISDFRVRLTLAPGSGSVVVRVTTSSDPVPPLANVVKQGQAGSTAGTSWLMRITDSSLNGPANVKAASTAAVATDPSLVVALSPNSALPTGANTIGALTANQSVNVAQVAGTATVTGGVAGILAVGGNVANAVAATANPVPVGGIFTTTPATLTTGQTATLQFTAAQNVKEDVTTIAGTATATAAAGVQKVGVVGNAGAAVDAANNAAMPANALSVGGQTLTIDASPTAATAGNLRYAGLSTEGMLYVQEGGPKRFSCVVPSTTTATTQCQAAPAAGLRAYVTSFHASNAAATVQTVDIVFGTGTNCATGTTALTHKWEMGTNATTTSPQSIEASFTTPLIPTAANAICVRPANPTAFGVTITGYVAP